MDSCDAKTRPQLISGTTQAAAGFAFEDRILSYSRRGHSTIVGAVAKAATNRAKTTNELSE